MGCPSINELPAPLRPGMRGWPWTEAHEPIVHGETAWPRLTVVTPSFNQGKFIEETIRSVLLQGYPNLEYIVIDGGSTDESVAIIQRYAPWLSYWVSEPDNGQSHAINKGFTRSTGEILCWLNSDDYFAPGALSVVARALHSRTGKKAIVGQCLRVNADGAPTQFQRGRYRDPLHLRKFWQGYEMPQSSIFWRRELFEQAACLQEDQRLIMDFDLWARITEKTEIHTICQLLSITNYHDAAKTGDNYLSYWQALNDARTRYWGSKWSWQYWALFFSYYRHRLSQ